VLEPPDPSLPEDVTLVLKKGSTATEIRSHAAAEAERIARQLQHSVIPRGTIPRKTVPTLQRDGLWFYEVVIKRESIRSIAKRDLGSVDRANDVRRGVNRARKLLEMTPFRFAGPGAIYRVDKVPRG
jgi:hypothetical protein